MYGRGSTELRPLLVFESARDIDLVLFLVILFFELLFLLVFILLLSEFSIEIDFLFLVNVFDDTVVECVVFVVLEVGTDVIVANEPVFELDVKLEVDVRVFVAELVALLALTTNS